INRLTAVNASAVTLLDISGLGVFTIRSPPITDAVSLESHLAPAWLTVRDNLDPPLLSLLAQPATVQQGCLTLAVRARDLPDKEESVEFFLFVLIHQCRVILQVVTQRLQLIARQRRSWK